MFLSVLKNSRRLLILLAVFWAGIVNLYLLIQFVFPYSLAPIKVINHGVFWFLSVSTAALALALILRASRYFLLWLAPGVLVFALWFVPVWLPKSTPHAEGPRFTAATFNVLGFATDPNDTFAVIKAINADIVGVEELRPKLEAKLKDELSDRYPYQISKVVQGFDGYALLSRYPIIESEIHLEVDLDHVDLDHPRYVRAVLDIEGQPVAVYLFHPPIPQPSAYNVPFYRYLFEYDDTHIQNQTTYIVQQVKAETLPTLLLCDCNASPHSREYDLLNAVLDEAFGKQGNGLGFTSPTEPFPVVRIDYIWYSDHFTPLKAEVGAESGGSDHRPVWAQLALTAH
ncbi:MAG TPA: endonuclease/exonuclease/phosphatase family protein [Aggregatilineaceae bacterium]|nr:endonuclease/exonuclease/phosphatase family protein [Aggregatilineaceae bacterium]